MGMGKIHVCILAFFQERDKVIIRRRGRCLTQSEGNVKARGRYDRQNSKNSVNIPTPVVCTLCTIPRAVTFTVMVQYMAKGILQM